jgi:putative cell wall-binding protein
VTSWWGWQDAASDEGLDYFKRIAGADRYETMKKIVKATYNISGDKYWTASVAVVASGENFPDALAANGLAGALNNGYGAPVILTKNKALSSDAKSLLQNLGVQTVYIMGGTSAVSAEVEQAIKNLKIATIRVAGADRQATSVEAFKLIDGNWYKYHGTHSVIIATGANYADALSIAPFAYKTGTPIVLTKADGTLTDDAVKAIKDNDEIYQVIVVGGTAAVSDSVFSVLGSYSGSYKDYYNKVYVPVRIAGADRYDTSAKVADWEINYALDIDNNAGLWGMAGFSMDEVFIATGENFPDALAGGQLAGGKWFANDQTAKAYLIEAKYNGKTRYVGDLNYAWKWDTYTSSPILLTKDGDRSADAVISKHLAWNFDVVSYNAYDMLNGLDNFFKMIANDWYLPEVEDQDALGFFLNGRIEDTLTNSDIELSGGKAYFIDGKRAEGSNFIGYILGGKNAVSKDKAKQLDETVKDSIRTLRDDVAVYDIDDVVIINGKSYSSFGRFIDLFNIGSGNVFGVDASNSYGMILPVYQNFGDYDYFYAVNPYTIDDNEIFFSEFKRDSVSFVDNDYTGYGWTGVYSYNKTTKQWKVYWRI